MTVYLEVDDVVFSIGTGAFFFSFFSTICVRLEQGEWGARFPALMDELYRGRLPLARVPAAREELATVRSELAAFGPEQVVWDIEDLDARPPWGSDIAETITSLANYFVTDLGSDLIEVIRSAFDSAVEDGEDVVVASL